MRTAFDATKELIELDFDSTEELDTYLETAESRGLFLVRLPEALQVSQSLSVCLRCGDKSRVVGVEVQQVFRSGETEHGTALRLLGEAPVVSKPEQSPPDHAPAEHEDGEPPARGETTGASIALEIRRLNVSQRLRLATRASRIERQILLRDSSPQVLMGLLANPRIDEQEVRELVRSPHAASGVLQHVAKDRRWSANYEVRLALVRNPKTPTPLAQRLLPTLRRNDLQTLAKSSNVREAIKGAALRLYLGKL